jgi:pimeloyl-ACP methyl ester carboxylesterase
VSRWNIDAEKSRLDEALVFLNGPDFIPAESQPAQLEFDGPTNFKFSTPRPCDVAENNVVYGRLYRGKQRWQELPVIILLHGGGDFFNYRFRFARLVPSFKRAGFNIATLVAPYHFQRRPHSPAPWNHLRTAQGFAQGVAEIRALTGWLLGEGCPAVALWGYSLGGWQAGLTACRDARIASAVLTAPGVRTNYKFSRAERVIWRRVREALRAQTPARQALTTTPLNLTLSRPAIPKENILLIEGMYDLFVEAEAIEELWQAWDSPEIWRLPHGHASWMFAPGLTGRVLRWLEPRLKKP